MKIKYENDNGRGPGYGKLVLSGFLPPEGAWKYSLQRGSDSKYVTSSKDHPWMDGINFIEGQGGVSQSGNLEILLGPTVVDGLDPNETYRLVLRGADKSENTGRFRTGKVIYSDAASLITPEIERTLDPIPGPGEAPIAERSAPEQLKMEPEDAGQDTEKISGTSEAKEAEKLGELSLEKPQKQSKRGLWYGLGSVASILLVCLIWFLADRFSGAPESEPKPEASAPPPAKELSAEERVREFFAKGDKTPAAAAALAGQIRMETPQDQDAVYRLYYYAAEKGDPQGMMGYAAALDPSRPAWGTIRKDGALALQNYAKAADSNIPGAAQAQDDLLKWMQKNSKSNP